MESPKLTVISVVMGKMEAFGRTEVTVHLRNDSQRTVIGVKVYADCYKDGKLITTEWQPAEPRELPAGAESAGSVHLAEGVTCDDVKARLTAFQ